MNTTVSDVVRILRSYSQKQPRAIDRIMITELNHEVSLLPISILPYTPNMIEELQKRIVLEEEKSRMYGVRYSVKEYPTIFVTDRAIWYGNGFNDILKFLPNSNPEDIYNILLYAISWLKKNRRSIRREAVSLYQKALEEVDREDKLKKLQQSVLKPLVEHLLPKDTPVNIEEVDDKVIEVFVGRYLNKYRRLYDSKAKLYSVQLNAEQFIQEQTIGPTGECSARLLELYDTWNKETRSKVSNTIIFKGKPVEIKNYKPTELEVQLANGEFDKLSLNEPDNDDSFDAVCLDDDKDVICEKIKEWERNGKI